MRHVGDSVESRLFDVSFFDVLLFDVSLFDVSVFDSMFFGVLVFDVSDVRLFGMPPSGVLRSIACKLGVDDSIDGLLDSEEWSKSG